MKAYELDNITLDGILTRRYLNKIRDAKERGIEFKLSYMSFRNLMKTKKCKYTGIPLTLTDTNALTRGVMQATDISLERVDPSKGYVSNNVIAVCHAANQYKSVVDDPSTILKPEHFFKMSKEWQKRLK